MADRSRDWMAQAEDNLESAVLLRQGGKHGSACFMAQQAAENAVITHSSREHWYQRPLDFDPPSEVPVNVDLFVYTEDEFAQILGRGDAFAHVMQNVVWL